MKMNRQQAWLAILLATFILGGCSSISDKQENKARPGAVVQSTGSSNANTSAANAGRGSQPSPLASSGSQLLLRKIYFDFDKSDIRADSIATLRAHAALLIQNSVQNVTIEGHADERGSREYNIGLGERRALAVKRFLEAEGVGFAQINTISYGEERPDLEGHNEASWAANRRAEILY